MVSGVGVAAAYPISKDKKSLKLGFTAAAAWYLKKCELARRMGDRWVMI